MPRVVYVPSGDCLHGLGVGRMLALVALVKNWQWQNEFN